MKHNNESSVEDKSNANTSSEGSSSDDIDYSNEGIISIKLKPWVELWGEDEWWSQISNNAYDIDDPEELEDAKALLKGYGPQINFREIAILLAHLKLAANHGSTTLDDGSQITDETAIYTLIKIAKYTTEALEEISPKQLGDLAANEITWPVNIGRRFDQSKNVLGSTGSELDGIANYFQRINLGSNYPFGLKPKQKTSQSRSAAVFASFIHSELNFIMTSFRDSPSRLHLIGHIEKHLFKNYLRFNFKTENEKNEFIKRVKKSRKLDEATSRNLIDQVVKLNPKPTTREDIEQWVDAACNFCKMVLQNLPDEFTYSDLIVRSPLFLAVPENWIKKADTRAGRTDYGTPRAAFMGDMRLNLLKPFISYFDIQL